MTQKWGNWKAELSREGPKAAFVYLYLILFSLLYPPPPAFSTYRRHRTELKLSFLLGVSLWNFLHIHPFQFNCWRQFFIVGVSSAVTPRSPPAGGRLARVLAPVTSPSLLRALPLHPHLSPATPSLCPSPSHDYSYSVPAGQATQIFFHPSSTFLPVLRLYMRKGSWFNCQMLLS